MPKLKDSQVYCVHCEAYVNAAEYNAESDECDECHDAQQYALDECGCERCYDRAVSVIDFMDNDR